MCFYRICGRRNLPIKAQKAQIWAGGNAGVKEDFLDKLTIFFSKSQTILGHNQGINSPCIVAFS